MWADYDWVSKLLVRFYLCFDNHTLLTFLACEKSDLRLLGPKSCHHPYNRNDHPRPRSICWRQWYFGGGHVLDVDRCARYNRLRHRRRVSSLVDICIRIRQCLHSEAKRHHLHLGDQLTAHLRRTTSFVHLPYRSFRGRPEPPFDNMAGVLRHWHYLPHHHLLLAGQDDQLQALPSRCNTETGSLPSRREILLAITHRYLRNMVPV